MVSEVEAILNEIRERVRADQEPGSAPGTLVAPEETSATPVVGTVEEYRSGNAESLNRLSAHLTTTTRAWDRLPPVCSNRTGIAARLELWIKARLKLLSRWFTWEQVNFNSAVHHALSDTLEALRSHEEALRTQEETLRGYGAALRNSEQELMRNRAEVRNEAASRLASLERSEREIEALRASIEAQAADLSSRISGLIAQNAAIEAQAAEARSRISDLTTQDVAIEGRVSETNAAQAELKARLSEINTEAGTRISSMAKEIDERLSALAADLREEQRVCFKQLSLEASEAAVLEDRGRRAIEARLEKLEHLRTPQKK
jgi:chromosome segregation ATPase